MKSIKSLSVKNSPFYEDLTVSFSQKLNCIMGGRGTGKSTMLFLLKACLSENIEDNEDVFKVLRSNLGLGELNILFEGDEEKTYNIQKILNEPPQVTFSKTGEFIHLEDIIEDIECDFYATSQIEFIGRDSLSRLKLIDKRSKSEIDEYILEMRKNQNDLFKNAQTIMHIDKQVGYVTEQLKQFAKAKEDFEKHKKLSPEGITDTEKKEFEEADLNEKRRNNEKRFLAKNIEILNEVMRNTSLISSDLSDYYGKIQDLELKKVFSNIELMNSSHKDTVEVIEKVELLLKGINEQILEAYPKFNKHSDSLKGLHLDQEADFVKLKAKYEKRRAYFDTYNNLSKRLAKKEELLSNLEDLHVKLKITKTDRIELIKQLNSNKSEILKIRQTIVKGLNSLFDGDIKITLTAGGIKKEFDEKLKKLLAGAGRYYTELIPRITERFTPDKLARIINEKDIESLKTIGGIDEQRGSIIIGLSGKQEIYDLEALYCPDLPTFFLRVIEGGDLSENYKESENLSMGQRCTTVLPIVFSVSNNPLIIDQPEDNLDNRYITNRIHDIIRQQKEERQIIFVTHNPNIPVLADSERNVFLEFETKSSVECTGSVDEVKESIIGLLEGGADAFVKRKEKYSL